MTWLKNNRTTLIIFIVTLSLISWIGWRIYSHKEQQLKYPVLKEDNTCLALNYHRVRESSLVNQFLRLTSGNNELRKYSVFEDEFDHQMNWLKKHDAEFLTQKEFTDAFDKGKFPKKCVWINFDDADDTTYTNALPILEKYEIPATVFVITGQVGNPNFNNISLMDWDHLKELKASGLFSFGSHTHNMHELTLDKPLYTTVPPEEFLKDLEKSKAMLKEKLDVDTETFAYPYGNANNQVRNVVEEAGFKHAFILSPKATEVTNGNLRINRIMVDHDAFDRHVKKWKQFK